MNFSQVYEDIEPGRYFNTVWVELSEIVNPFLAQSLGPIQPKLNWSVLSNSHGAKSVPHITLRYLGYDSPELRSKMNSDEDKFKEVVKRYAPLSIDLKDIFIWEGVNSRGEKNYRLNWRIINSEELKRLHQELLSTEGYSFFQSLEGNNFMPHISLGEINTDLVNSVEEVRAFLESLPESHQTLSLTKFGLNFASPDIDENYRIPLI